MLPIRSSLLVAASIVAFTAASLIVPTPALAQADGLVQKIETTYQLTKPTADMTDIVKPGDVLVLQKDNLFMCSIVSAIPSYNTYKDGKIRQSLLNGMKFFTASGNAPTVPTRVFVGGEKVMLTGVEVKEDNVQLTLLSDVVNGERYTAYLKFPYPKGTTPATDDMLRSIAQVVSVLPAVVEKPVVSTSQTIAIGQTPEQVKAILGQPMTVAKLGGKEIDYFPGMKVTFIHGHVADVQ